MNHGFDPVAYLERFPVYLVEEVHLAGCAAELGADGARLLIDAHDRPIDAAVWDLYTRLLARSGPLPTLVEWDNDVPAFPVLLAEAQAVERALDVAVEAAHARAP